MLSLLFLHEGYLRLSRIARDIGRLDEASVWVSRALTVEEMDPDAGVSLGDLYAGGQRWDEAKKCYEKVIVKVRSCTVHDI
jgi:tetratricopeptide (TPR) repeat protein